MTPRPLDGPGLLFVGPLLMITVVIGGVLFALGSRLSAAELWAALLSRETLFAVRLSLVTSIAALATAVILALPAAYALERYAFPGRGLVAVLVELPLVMPPLVTGLGLLFLFGHRLLGAPLAALGLDLLFSPAGVVVAQAFVATTVLLRSARGAFAGIEPRLREAGAALRAAPWDVFWSIEIPVAAPALLAGGVLAWSRAISEFGATLMLAGASRLHTETLPMAVFLTIATGETGVAVACALILLGVAAVLLLALQGVPGRPAIGEDATPHRHQGW